MDAAASSLKPKTVIDAETLFLSKHYANAGRGVCARATAADDMVHNTRKFIAQNIGAKSPDQIVFTSNATDGLNRVARILAGKTVIVSDIDHHSARLPFEAHCKTITAPLTESLGYDWDEIRKIKADAIVITAMSNVLGVSVDIPDDLPFITIIDASQHIVHQKPDVKDFDFFIFTAHKVGADTGLGILYQKNPPEPINFGGGMYKATGAAMFEAGTLPLTQIAGLMPAVKNLDATRDDTHKKIARLYEGLSKNPKIKFISPADASLISFTADNMNYLDFGMLMGAHDVCLRVGNMCASWIHNRLGIMGSCRLSLGFWNTDDEIAKVLDIIKSVVK
jgi:cysteine desulfurase/selenocysteine lyase